MKKIVSVENGKIAFTPPSKNKPAFSSRQFLKEASKGSSQANFDQPVTPEQVLDILNRLAKNDPHKK